MKIKEKNYVVTIHNALLLGLPLPPGGMAGGLGRGRHAPRSFSVVEGEVASEVAILMFTDKPFQGDKEHYFWISDTRV